MTKNNKNHQSTSSMDRKITANEMTMLFALGAKSKKENPQRWSKERRTDYNERSKMIQSLFDEGAYASVKTWLNWLDSDHQLTGRKVESNTSQNDQKTLLKTTKKSDNKI